MDKFENANCETNPNENNLNEREAAGEECKAVSVITALQFIHELTYMDGDQEKSLEEMIRENAPDVLKGYEDEMYVFVKCLSMYFSAAHRQTDCSFVDYMFAKSIASLFNYLRKQLNK